MNPVIIIMGVSGSGKSTVGEALARQLNCPFYDGDDFHPPENVAKMASGTPLDDNDRRPWLLRLRDLVATYIASGKSAVIACSALKYRYRNILREGNPGLKIIYLHGDFDLIWQRMQTREGHYMKPAMLRSQFEALELPSADEALQLSVEDDVNTLIATIMNHLT